MRLGNYVVRPDHVGWIVATIKVRGSEAKQAGEEYETDVVYPSTFAQALSTLLDRMVRDGLDPDASIHEAVATVAHLYAHIGDAVANDAG